MNCSLLLFDIDGTLMGSHGAGVQAMRTVAAGLFGAHHSWDGIEFAGHMDPLIFAEFARRNSLPGDDGQHAAFHRDYLLELPRALERKGPGVHLMPGVADTLALLRQREQSRGDVMLGLLTGNYAAAVPIKFAAVRLDPAWFRVHAFGDHAPTRPDLVPHAMHQFQTLTGRAIDARRVIVIGDTPRDVQCAKAHDCVALGVATGTFSVDDLRQAGADVAVPDLSDPRPLLALLP